MPGAAQTTVIGPGRGWFDIAWREIVSYRELIVLLARRDVSVIYKQTILGPVWLLIQPVLNALVFAVIFGRVAGIGTGAVPQLLFYMSGLLAWNYFRGVFEGTSQTFTHNTALFTKVYFPRLCVPLSFTLSNLVYFSLNLLVFAAFYLWFVLVRGTPIRPTLWLLGLPVAMAYVACIAMGTGLWVAALTTKYRDLSFSMPFLLQVWMYVTPIVYPISQTEAIPALHAVVAGNPMTLPTEAIRYMLTGQGDVTWAAVRTGSLTTLVVLVLGLGLLNRIQRRFVDTI